MSELTNAQKMRLVYEWQTSGFRHPLTCRLEGCRQDLVPREVEGKVVLVCPDCGTVQQDIPESVFHGDLAAFFRGQ